MKKIIAAFSILVMASAFVAFAQDTVPLPPTDPSQPPVQQGQPMWPQPMEGGNIQPLPPQQPGEPGKPPMPGNGQSFPPKPPMPGDGQPFPPGGSEGQPFPPEGEGEDFRDMVEPREIQDALRQIQDIKREINRVLKAVKKTAGFDAEISQLKDLLNQLAPFETTLKSGNVDRETMSEFWDSQFWDSFNVIRLRIELPKEIARMEKDMKRLDKSLAKTKYVLAGLDMNAVRGAADRARSTIAQVKGALASGSYEDAQEAMQSFWDGEVANPGEIIGVVDRTQNIARELRGIKSTAVKQEIMDFLAPIIEAANGGDFREANMMFNEVDRFIFQIMGQLKRKSSVDTQTKFKMDQFEQRMMQKLQEEEQKKMNNQQPTSGLMPYKNYRSASLLDNVLFSIADFFGF